MDKIVLARQLCGVADQTQAVYLRVEPELPDFTIHTPGTIKVMSQRGQVDIPFDRTNIREVVSLLDVAIFTGEKAVITWNFKNFISYVRHYTKKHREYPCKLFDLKLMEGFMGNRGRAPVDFAEAQVRVMELSKDQTWKPVYEAVNLPLATRVVPALECEGIVDIANRRIAYAHYEIDRATTGRMVCQVPSKGYSPHAIGESDNYKPRGEDELFLYFDFKSMEIRILQWLSGDVELGAIIGSKTEMYAAAWEKITGQTAAPDKWKSSFLALFFGMGADEMASRHGWTPEIAREVIRRAHKVFPRAFGYVLDAQDRARHAPVRDFFGRARDLRETPHKARNHVIQAAANVVCMTNLIKLHDNMPEPARLAYSVHDGYALFCTMRATPEVVSKVLPILESEVDLCPGLKLEVSAKVGARLNKMATVPDAWRTSK